VDKKTIDKQKV